MIRLLSEKDRDFLLQNLFPVSYCSCKIRALCRLYGMCSPLARFYADEKGNFFALEENFLTVYLKDPSAKKEVEELCLLTAGEVLSEAELSLSGFSFSFGNVYQKAGAFPASFLRPSGSLKDAYEILAPLFPDTINEWTFSHWYASLSHQVRHGMSKVYTIPQKATATLYCKEGNFLLLSQLGVTKSFRRQGLARSLLAHVFSDNVPANQMLLCSHNANSDFFYEHLNFISIGKWYFCQRK